MKSQEISHGDTGAMSRRADSVRAVVEDFARLDAAWLRRAGALTPGWAGRWPAAEGGVISGCRVAVGIDELTVELAIRARLEPARFTVGLVRLPCRFGGERVRFVCPCGRHSNGLLLGEPSGCRICLELSYQSRKRSPAARRARRLARLRAELGERADRPAYMRRARYDRIRREIADLEAGADPIVALTKAARDRLGRRGSP